MPVEALVRAAGGVVRRGSKILLVHRPRYDDWTFPKGKAEGDEPDEDCALREVREETRAQLPARLGAAVDELHRLRGRPKRVRYWLMEPVGGAFRATREVDEVRWCEPAEAEALLSYDRDRAVLARSARLGSDERRWGPPSTAATADGSWE